MAQLNVPSLNPAQFMALLPTMFQTEMTPVMWGSPGIGKTQMVRQFSKNQGFAMPAPWELQTISPGDLLMPMADEGKSSYDFRVIRRFTELGANGQKTILFLDELDKIGPDVISQVMSILLERRLGDHVLPDHVRVIAAGNELSDGAGGYEMNTAVSDRVVHFKIKPEARQWLDWATHSGNIHPAVCTFIQNRSDMLDQSSDFINLVRCTPRSWERVSKVLWINDNPNEVSPIIAGIIGMENTATFIATLNEIRDLPDVKQLLKATDEELIQLGRNNFDTASKVYCLAYALLGICANAKSVCKALRIFMLITQGITMSSKEELRTAGVKILIPVAKKKGWLLSVLSDATYTKYVSDFITSKPDLASLVQSRG